MMHGYIFMNVNVHMYIIEEGFALLLFDAIAKVFQLHFGGDVMYQMRSLSQHFYRLKGFLTSHII